MRIASIGQRSIEEAQQTRNHLLVCASGYEVRARHAAPFLRNSDRRMVLAFAEHVNGAEREANDLFFRTEGFEFVTQSGDSEDTPARVVSAIQEALTSTSDPILTFDLSSMTRSWYASIVRLLRILKADRRVITRFCYSPAKFAPPSKTYPQNKIVEPLRGFSSLAFPDRPSVLALGLGDHRGRALGLVEEIDPRAIFTFHAHPAIDKRYEKEALSANDDVLELVARERRFSYPLLDFPTTLHLVDAVCQGFGADAGVVLASLGPKSFALAALLIATVREHVSVWRISASDRAQQEPRPPAGPIVVAEVTWEPDKVET